MRAADGGECLAELFGRLYACEVQFDRQRGRSSLQLVDELCVAWGAWIPEDRYPGSLRQHLLEQLQLLCADVGRLLAEPRYVAARMCEVRDQPRSDWIADIHHYDRNGGRGTLGRLC